MSQHSYTVRVIKEYEELELLRSTWESWNRSPNCQFDFVRLIGRLRKSIVSPYVIVIYEHAKIVAMGICRIVDQEFRISFGYKTLSCGKVRELQLLQGGILGGDSDPSGIARLVVGSLMNALRAGEANLLYFSHVRTDSPMFKVALKAPILISRDWAVKAQRHWKMVVPTSYEAFLSRLSKKHRYWLKRLEKVLDAEFPGRVTYRTFNDYSDVSAFAADIDKVAYKTYQRGLGAGFTNDGEFIERLKLGANSRTFRGLIMFIDDRPVAFWMGTLYKEVFYSEYTGYDPEYRHLELGTIVFTHLIRTLCLESAKGLDFGLGDALYKSRFGDASWAEGSIHIFPVSLRGLTLNILHTTSTAAESFARLLLRICDFEGRIKRLWRNKLPAKVVAPGP